MATDGEVIKAFLADRDVACPGCGYNLQGCAAEVCPECGAGIEIVLRGDTTSPAAWIAGTVAISSALGLAVPAAFNSTAASLFAPDYFNWDGPVLRVPMAVGVSILLWAWITRRVWLLRAAKGRAWKWAIVLGTIAWSMALTPFFMLPTM